jgi:hypothetical protein
MAHLHLMTAPRQKKLYWITEGDISKIAQLRAQISLNLAHSSFPGGFSTFRFLFSPSP